MASNKFKTLIKSVRSQNVIIPQIQASLHDASFPGFTVPIPAFTKRIPDGRFHPSTHPTWSEDKLLAYLKGEDGLEALELHAVMAVTQGTFWHAFIQNLGIADGWLRVMDPYAPNVHDKAEYWVEDEELGTSGHMDGILNSDFLDIPEDQGFEMKTMIGNRLRECPDGPPESPGKVAWIKDGHEVYYAQAQEYLRMSGYSHQRFFFLTLEYPYPMVEVVVPFDIGYSQQIVEKYRRVRQRFNDGNHGR